MSTNQSNQAVKEKKNTADSKTKGKQKYRRAAKDANAKLGSSEVRAKKTRPTKDAAIRTAAAVEETKSFRRRTVTEDASQDDKKERSKKREKPARVRVFPIWLRIIIVTILCAFALVTGLMIGYGVLGDGAPIDALKVETWRHIIDIVIKE